MSHPFGRLREPARRDRLHLLRRAPRYRWTVVDYLLFAIPLAAVVLAAGGRAMGLH